MGLPDAKILDHMVNDGLWDAFNDLGVTAENRSSGTASPGRTAALRRAQPHQLAAKAHSEESFAGQIVPVPIKQKKQTVEVHHRRARAARLHRGGPGAAAAGIQEGRSRDGRQRQRINDGAAMMLVTSVAKAEEFGLPVSGRLVSAAVSGVDPAYMGIGMVPASLKALLRLIIDDIDVVEANEGVRLGRPSGAAGAQGARRG